LDPISHLLFGHTLYCLDSRRRTERGAAAGYLLASVLPDIDGAIVPFGMDVYLLAHEAGTHSLAGSPLVAAVLATGLSLTLKGARFVPLFLVSWAAVAGHLFIDLVDGGGLRLFAPLSEIRYGWHLVSMWDPLVLVPLILAFLASRIQSYRRRFWARAVMIVLTFVFAMKAVSQKAADSVFAWQVQARNPAVELRWREEVSGSLFQWRYIDKAGDRMRVWIVDSWKEDVQLTFERHVPGDDEMIRASRRFSVVRNLLRLSDLPVAWLEVEGDYLLVHWSDMRFCDPAGCAMSFGVAFDKERAPLWEFIDAGTFRQTRAISRED